MARETVDIQFRSTGIPVIKRQLDELGLAANRATRGFFLLQRAMYTIGGFGLARALTSSLDALTNMENRLRLTTNSAAEMESVQKELFQVALRSRSSWEGVSEVYNRAALSAKALGIAQQDVMIFTEGVSKAAVISGAGAQEARAALIQLGQAVASNRLGGDELRSVLEQLPLVADMIAKYMTSLGTFGTVNRGNIRELGKEGKITAQIMIDAFKYAKAELDQMFADMPLTIGQSIEAMRTYWAMFLDSFDDATGVSTVVAGAIMAVAQNLDLLATSGLAVAGVLGAMFAGKVLQSIASYITSLRVAGVQQTAFIARMKATQAVQAQSAAATVASSNADLLALQRRQAYLNTTKAALLVEARNTEFVIRDTYARNLQTGQFTSLTASKARLEAITIQLSRLEAAEAPLAARLTAARVAQANATNALAGAQGRLAATTAAQATAGARLAAQFPLIAGAVNMLTNAFRMLWLTMLANPIIAVVAALAGVAMVIYSMRDAMISFGGTTASLGSVVTVLWGKFISGASTVWEYIKGFFTWFANGAMSLATSVGEWFDSIGLNGKNVANILIGVFASFAGATMNSFYTLYRVAMAVLQGIAQAGRRVMLGLAAAVLGDFESSATLLGNAFTGSLDRIIKEGTDGTARQNKIIADNMGRDWVGGIASGIEAGKKWVADSMEGVMTEAAALDKLKFNQPPGGAGTPPVPPGGGAGGGGGSDSKSFQDLIAAMNQEISLLKMSNKERTIAQELLKMEKELKRGLTEQERELAIATIQSLEAAKMQAEILESIIGPREKAIDQMAALNVLYQEGRISLNQYTDAMREFKVAADEASGTLMGGFKAAIGASITSAMEFGKAIGQQVVGFVDSAASAIAEFAKTGKINIKELFRELFANLVKLAAQRLMLSFIGNMFGFGASGGLGGGGGLPGFSTGGSILPNGPGSTDSQIVAFKKRPDERVDILTPGQQAAQKNASGGSGQTVVQSPPVNVAALLSPSDIVGAFDQEGDTVIIRMIARNATTIKRTLG